MRAALFTQPHHPLTIEDVTIGSPGPHEVLVRPRYAGLCHSDLHYLDGLFPWPLPAVLGHESAGVVEAVGSEVRDFRPGDHVVSCLSVFCGACRNCVSGLPNVCSDQAVKLAPGAARRLWKDGEVVHQFLNLSSFAEQMLVHEHALVRIDADVPLDRATLLGCGVMTGFGAVTNAAQVRPGSTVAVLGCGGIGMAAINAAAIAGAARIIAIDRQMDKFDLARHLGATDTIAASPDIVAAVRDLTAGGVDYSFEAIGLPETAQQAFSMLRPGGLATVIGMIPAGKPIMLDGIELVMERRIQGSIMGGGRFRVDIPRMLDLWHQGRLKLDALRGEIIPFDAVNDGFRKLKAGTSGRILLAMPS